MSPNVYQKLKKSLKGDCWMFKSTICLNSTNCLVDSRKSFIEEYSLVNK